MLLYQYAELLAITFGLSGTYARNILQFFQSHRIDGRHCLQRRILENNIRRNIQFLGQLLTQVFQHRVKHRIDRTRGASPNRSLLFFLLEVIVLDNLERLRLFQEFMPFGSNLQQTIVLYIFA